MSFLSFFDQGDAVSGCTRYRGMRALKGHYWDGANAGHGGDVYYEWVAIHVPYDWDGGMKGMENMYRMWNMSTPRSGGATCRRY